MKKMIQVGGTTAVAVGLPRGISLNEGILVIGAMLEEDSGKVKKVMEGRPKDKMLRYLCLTAILQIPGHNHFFEREAEELLEPFLLILKGGGYEGFPFAKNPEDSSSIEKHIRKVFRNRMLCYMSYAWSTEGAAYKLENQLKKLSLMRQIVKNHVLVDQGTFFDELAKELESKIDEHFLTTFATSTKAVFKTRKDGGLKEYFIHQLCLYNDDLSKRWRVRLQKRYEAWMRVEARHASKVTVGKPQVLKKEDLLLEVREVIKSL